MSGFVIVQHTRSSGFFYTGQRHEFTPSRYGPGQMLPMYHASGDYAWRADYKPAVEQALVFASEAAAIDHIYSLPTTKFDMVHPVTVMATPPPRVLTQLDLFNISIEADTES